MPPRKKTTPPRVAQRVLIDGLTADQDEVLRTVQYRTGMLVGHDTLYLAGRPGVAGAETESAVRQPTKRQVNSWLKGEKGFQRQKTSGAALPKHKPVAIIRRSRPVQYVQFDAFQLPERELPIRVTYKNKNRNRVSVPLVNSQCPHLPSSGTGWAGERVFDSNVSLCKRWVLAAAEQRRARRTPGPLDP